MSPRQTGRFFASAMMLAALLAPRPVSADFKDNVRQFFGGAQQTPPASIVQVLAPEPGALSRGSGTLIHVDGDFGYVISNWHVVRDAPGDVVVIFPDGHQSLARVLKTDKDWDLALLLIWRGDSPPMPLAAAAPQPGEPLTIAGYGGEGEFRAARGVFTTYAAPQPDMPYEMFEVSVAARQGDSGGPIVNQRGELAGVLFGAGDGRTTGTQVHRVRDFVNEALYELREQAEAVAQSPLQPPIANPPQLDQPAPAFLPQDQVVARDGASGSSEAQVPQQYIPPGALPASPLPSSDRFAGPTPRPSRPPASPAEMARSQPPAPEDVAAASPWAPSPQESPQWLTRQRETQLNEPPQFDERGFSPRYDSGRDFPSRVEFGREPQPTPVASIGADERPGGVHAPVQRPPRRPRVPAGGVTWDQLKSFFAAVGVFAVLNTVTQTLFVAKKRK